MYAKITKDKDVKNIVEGYEKYTGIDLRIQKTSGATGRNLSTSD